MVDGVEILDITERGTLINPPKICETYKLTELKRQELTVEILAAPG